MLEIIIYFNWGQSVHLSWRQETHSTRHVSGTLDQGLWESLTVACRVGIDWVLSLALAEVGLEITFTKVFHYDIDGIYNEIKQSNIELHNSAQ